jgi:3-hydroxyisobutyrate dehydrogenase-like beta-hydroxyacid dehydrogenase
MTDWTGGRIGVIGLGRMGGAIARKLMASGASVVGHDIDDGRMDALAAAGARPARSAAEVARNADLILLLLPSASALNATTSGPTSLLTEVGSGSVVIEMSTLAIEAKIAARDRLGKVGATLLDAPISGTAIQADTGDLVVYASGDPVGVALACRALAPACREVFDVGAFGNGTRLKLLANQLVAIHIAAAGEVLAVARRAGLDAAETVRLLSAGAGSSRMLSVRGPMMAEHRYEPASMSVGLFQKDLRLIDDLARSVGASVPLFDAAAAQYRAASARGSDDLDTAAVHEISLAASPGLASSEDS